VFGDKYLLPAGVDGLVFPHVSHEQGPTRMRPSIFNKRIKAVWSQFARSIPDNEKPPTFQSRKTFAGMKNTYCSILCFSSSDDLQRLTFFQHVFCSSYVRHAWVTAIHGFGTDDQIAEQMSHSVATATKHYEASDRVEASSRSTALFRLLMGVEYLKTAGIGLPSVPSMEWLVSGAAVDDGGAVEPDSDSDSGDSYDEDEDDDKHVSLGDGVARSVAPTAAMVKKVQKKVPVFVGSKCGAGRGSKTFTPDELQLLMEATKEYQNQLALSGGKIESARVTKCTFCDFTL
jgi:hypothetical protein